MKRIFYYTTTAIIISCGITQAQTCVPTPTCSSLGYTSTTACDGGLKCPFGEAWYCPSGGSQDMTELCSLMGYTQTCTGSGYSGGTGQTCDGFYKECICDNTADWNGTICECKSTYKYTCTGSYEEVFNKNDTCGGKYRICTCESPYKWDNSSGSCVCAAKNTCTGEHEIGPGYNYKTCNGLYTDCRCETGYHWCGALNKCTDYICLEE